MLCFPYSVQCCLLFIFGTCIGSFLCVCIERWSVNQSVVFPNSHCPFCKKNIPWTLNIPVISWLWLRGKTQCCNKKIPIYYLLCEVFIGLIAVYIFNHSTALFIPYFILFCLLWVAFFTDIKAMIIPDEVSLLGLFTGIILCYFYPELQQQTQPLAGFMTSLQAACCSVGGIFIFASIIEYFLKQEAFGLGDVKLIGCIGAFLGLDACLFSLFAGAILGTIFTFLDYGFRVLVLKQHIQLKHKRIPFGPFLASAAVLYMFYADHFFN